MSEALWVGGRPIVGAHDLVARYCGLPAPDGSVEVWAFAYFDRLRSSSDPDVRLSVVASAALHSGLSKSDLAWFAENCDAIEALLGGLPVDVSLASCDESVVDALENVGALAATPTASASGVSVSLLTKVLHHNRPALVPMLDRALVDAYRGVLRTKGEAAWPELVHGVRADLRLAENRMVLKGIVDAVDAHFGAGSLSALRALDIASWMSAVRSKESR